LLPDEQGRGAIVHKLLVLLIAGWSGFFLMAIELLGGRILTPNFGSSIQVWGSVITVFMLALSLGYLVGGRLSVHDPSLTKLSMILLAAAAMTAPVILIGDRVMDLIFAWVQDPRGGSLIAATLLFFIPTLLAGMVSPYAVSLMVRECRMSGQHAGFLFFVSTFGSALGTLLTSFYLVLYLDINQILWLLIGVSTTIGLSTALMGILRFKFTNLEQKGL
jgi:hypothetical protein